MGTGGFCCVLCQAPPHPPPQQSVWGRSETGQSRSGHGLTWGEGRATQCQPQLGSWSQLALVCPALGPLLGKEPPWELVMWQAMGSGWGQGRVVWEMTEEVISLCPLLSQSPVCSHPPRPCVPELGSRGTCPYPTGFLPEAMDDLRPWAP